jgi:hypothetical protein
MTVLELVLTKLAKRPHTFYLHTVIVLIRSKNAAVNSSYPLIPYGSFIECIYCI